MENESHRDSIAIVDFGSQYAHLIANRIRRLGVYSVIVDEKTPIEELKSMKGIILSGGPQAVTASDSPKVDPAIFDMGVPVLGICYGHQLMAYELGGKVVPGTRSEYGRTVVTVDMQGTLLAGLSNTEEVWMSHTDSVHEVPEGFSVLASSEQCPVCGMENIERNLYGVQFHPEVAHTLKGMQVLENFVFKICKSEKSWSLDAYIEELLDRLPRVVGDQNIFLLVSGGVDSVVTYALLEKALGPDRVYGLHIDNGLMRKDETKQIVIDLEKVGIKNLHVVDATQQFLKALDGVADPEKKRLIIGETFLKVANDAMEKLDFSHHEWILAQGTIYPDTIETGGTKHAAKIKTHHNQIPAVKELITSGRLIEPLDQLYKDEVRELGRKLGLPESLVNRHPFPGPGLGVRVLCTDGTEQIDGIDELTRQVEERSIQHGLKARVLPLRSVGVQGDYRTYAHPAVLVGDADWDVLDRVSREITNNVEGVNRVVWWCESEADAGVKDMIPDFQLERVGLTGARLDKVREADKIVHDVMRTHGLEKHIWQCPVVLLPVRFDGGDMEGEVIVLRPVESQEAMTANFYRMERLVLDEMCMKIEALDGVAAVFYDVTNKPPGTIEWE